MNLSLIARKLKIRKLLHWKHGYDVHYYPNLGLKFYRISKNGSSSIRKMLRPYEGKKGRSNYYSFAVIRNPVDRLISAYQNIVKPDKQYVMLAQEFRGNSFVEFVLWVARQDLRYADAHIRFQHVSIPNHLDRVLCFERFNDDLRELLDDFNVAIDIPHKNKSPKSVEISDDLRVLIQLIYIEDYILWKQVKR